MEKDIVVEAEPRTDKGKNASRRLRHAGKVPAVLYGGGGEPQPLTVDPKIITAILHSESGENTLFALKIGAKGVLPGRVIIKEHQVDPITDMLTHADFMRIAMDKMIRVQVLVHTVGTAPGVKLQGGILDHPLREVVVECLPADIPERIDVDISELDMGKSYRVSDLVPPAGVKILTDPHMPVVAVVAPTIEKVAVPVEGAVAAEAPAEPEVIKKGKAETAEEGEAPPDKKGADKGGKTEKKPEKK